MWTRGSKWEEMDGKGKLRRVSAKECELDTGFRWDGVDGKR